MRPPHVTAVLVTLLLGAALLAGRLLWEFLGAIVLALVLVSLFRPLHASLVRWLGGRSTLAAAATTLLIFLGVVAPAGWFAAALAQQAFDLYAQNRHGPLLAEALRYLQSDRPLAVQLREVLDFHPEEVEKHTAALVKQASLFAYEQLSGVASNLVGLLVDFGVMMILVFTLLVHGPQLKSYLMDLSPLPAEEEEALIRRFGMISRAVFLGAGTAAALQGVLGGLGFVMFGLGSGALWGATIGITAFLPIVGAAVVFVPASAYFFLAGRPIAGVLFLAYNVLYTSVLEYGLKPRLIGGQSRMHAVLVFLGILAGLKLFGILGLFYGPLIFTMFLALVDIYKERYRPAELAPASAPLDRPPVEKAAG